MWQLSRDLGQMAVRGIHVPRGGAFPWKERANAKVWQLLSCLAHMRTRKVFVAEAVKGRMEKAGAHLLFLPPTLVLSSHLGLCIHQGSPGKENQWDTQIKT